MKQRRTPHKQSSGCPRCPACNQPLPRVRAERRQKRKKDRADGKYDARRAVRLAIKAGILIKGPCLHEDREECSGQIEAHHYLGYAKKHWLKVQWLCTKHHRVWEKHLGEF